MLLDIYKKTWYGIAHIRAVAINRFSFLYVLFVCSKSSFSISQGSKKRRFGCFSNELL